MNRFTCHNWFDEHITTTVIGETVMFYADLGFLVANYESGAPTRLDLELPGTTKRLKVTLGDVPGEATLLIDDIESMLAAFVKHGGTVDHPISEDGSLVHSARVVDPFGNIFTLIQLDYQATANGKVLA